MKTTIIELLNKIANGEEPPKRIIYKCDDEEYIFEYDEYNFDYQNEWGVWLFEDICFDGENHLNKEVEILETTITYKQDEPIFKKIDCEWYVRKDFNPNDNIIFVEKEKQDDKIEKIDVDWQFVFDEQAQQDFAKMTLNKINKIIDKVNKL